MRTVLGDISPEALGRTDIHEHLLMASPLLPGDELTSVAAASEEAATFRAAGMDALVELTPLGLGRAPEGLARIARETGLHIIAATGLHQQDHYSDGHPILAMTDDGLADRLVRDLTEGCAEPHAPRSPIPVRAGVLKAGTGYWRISATERRFLDVVARAQRRTGAAIVCHLERGTAGPEVLEILTSLGVPPERVAFAHLDRNPDPGLHAEIAATGAHVCYDGPGRAKDWPDSVLIDCLAHVVDAGYAARLLVGADVARRSRFRAHGGFPGLTYLPRRFLPRLRERVGAAVLEAILVDNPARLLAMELPSPEGTSPRGDAMDGNG